MAVVPRSVHQIVGGALFGVGMVLAGGCVSGSLFKAGIGHLNSMVALPAIALGVAAVEHGPLRSCHAYMKTHIVKTADGAPVTIASLTGLPFWALAAIFAVATLLAGLAMKRRKEAARECDTDAGVRWSQVLTAKSWKPWQSGLAIGILGALAYLSSAASGRNYPLGVTHGVLHLQLLITDSGLKHVWRRPSPQTDVPASQNAGGKTKAPRSDAPRKKVSWWLVAAVVSLIVGSWVAAKLSGSARLLPKPPDQVIVAFIGGILVGAGAAFARGCVVGNIMSGWALMSVGTILFGVVAMLANWAATYFYIMGGTLFERGE